MLSPAFWVTFLAFFLLFGSWCGVAEALRRIAIERRVPARVGEPRPDALLRDAA